MKTTSNNYHELVSQARSVVNVRKNSQRYLADLAMKACTIRYGGRHGSLYTMSQFAKDTGINKKTLSKWIQERRVDVTINKNKKGSEKKSLSEIRKITRVLREESKIGKDSRSKYVNLERIINAEIKSKEGTKKELDRNIKKISEVYSFLKLYGAKKITEKETKKIKSLLKRCNDLFS